MKTKQFHLGDILSITHDRLVSPRKIEGVYDLLNHMTGEDLFTHQLPRAARICKPALLKQLPQLDTPEMQFQIGELILMLDTPSGKTDPSNLCQGWLAKQVAKYGETFEVAPLSSGEYVAMDPMIEAEAMVGKDRIVRVDV